ncbi:MAG TPA: hypothetical protein P5077_10365 [bacterium]|nr:hypothetical protein [bacterium]
MTRYLFIFAALLATIVGCEGEGAAFYLSRVSDCGGFDAPTVRLFAVEECDEMLTWTYDKAGRTLTLLNSDVILNCGAEGAGDVEVVKDEGKYKIVEWSRPELTANCMCRFDYETTLKDIAPGTLTMAVVQHFLEYIVSDDARTEDPGERIIWSGTLDLSQGSGVFFVKTQDYCW